MYLNNAVTLPCAVLCTVIVSDDGETTCDRPAVDYEEFAGSVLGWCREHTDGERTGPDHWMHPGVECDGCSTTVRFTLAMHERYSWVLSLCDLCLHN